jgi:serine/threonine protein kinase
METCPGESELVAFMGGRLGIERAAWVERHAAECRICRDLLAGVAWTENAARTTGPVTLSGRPGERVGRYAVTRQIGAGAMGAVYEAHDPELDRRVALKLVQVEDDSVEGEKAARTRVAREAQAMARLSHPNVIHVYEVGTQETLVFIAMELIDGPNLRDWLAANGPPWRDTVRLFAEAGAGLEAAHGAGLVHRDFKPDNVLVGRDGRVTVSDFGLARAASGVESRPPAAPPRYDAAGVLASPITRTGAVLGTPAYMAPEQVLSGTVDARADIFSFCVALYEGLYGCRPFAGDTLSQLLANAHANDVRRPPPGPVPDAVFRVVLRGLRARPEERWGSMRELLDALNAAVAPARRRSIPAWLYALAVLVVAGSALGWRVIQSASRKRAGGADPRAAADEGVATPPLVFHPRNPRRITFNEGCELSPSFTPDGKTLVYKAMGSSDSAPLLLRTLSDPSARQLTPPKTFTFNPAVSPDGATIAYKRWSKEHPLGLYLMPLAGEGDPRLLIEGIGHPSWTRDGLALWGEDRTALLRVRAADGKVEEKVPSPAGFRPGPTLERADGSLVAVYPRFGSGTSDGGVAIIGPASDSRYIRWLTHGDFEETLALSPDERHALVVTKLPNGEPSLVDVPLDGSPISSLAGGGIFPTRGIAVAPDRHGLVWSTCRDYVRLARMGGDGKAEDLEPGNGWEDRRVEWLPQLGRLVVLSSRGGHGLQPWLVDPAHKEAPRPIAAGDRDVTGVAPSPDGTLLALSASNGGILVVPVDGSSPPRAVTSDPADREPTFRFGGMEILFERPRADGSSRIMAVPVAGGEPRTILEGRVRAPAASPVDMRVVYFEVGDKAEMTFMLFDPVSGKASPVSPDVPKTIFTETRFSPDGTRASVVSGGQVLHEVDLTSRKVVWRSQATDGLESFAYTPGGIFLTHTEWSGDLWVADDAF